MLTKTRATIEDLYHAEGKAELINGEIVIMPPTGILPSIAGSEIFVSLYHYELEHGGGRAFDDNIGYHVNLPHRKSFSPDASFCENTTLNMKFMDDVPCFAVEIRSDNDYGLSAEEAIEAKIADYFAAGTQVVWDVDLLGSDVVKKYTADNPNTPQIFRRGDTADAEPAVPGWTMAVRMIFRRIDGGQ